MLRRGGGRIAEEGGGGRGRREGRAGLGKRVRKCLANERDARRPHVPEAIASRGSLLFLCFAFSLPALPFLARSLARSLSAPLGLSTSSVFYPTILSFCNSFRFFFLYLYFFSNLLLKNIFSSSVQSVTRVIVVPRSSPPTNVSKVSRRSIGDVWQFSRTRPAWILGGNSVCVRMRRFPYFLAGLRKLAFFIFYFFIGRPLYFLHI